MKTPTGTAIITPPIGGQAPSRHTRPLYEYGAIIRADYRQQGRPMPDPVAVAVDAFEQLTTLADDYYAETGAHAVAFFLGNCGSWRGAVARQVKQDLRTMLNKHFRGAGMEDSASRRSARHR